MVRYCFNVDYLSRSNTAVFFRPLLNVPMCRTVISGARTLGILTCNTPGPLIHSLKHIYIYIYTDDAAEMRTTAATFGVRRL